MKLIGTSSYPKHMKLKICHLAKIFLLTIFSLVSMVYPSFIFAQSKSIDVTFSYLNVDSKASDGDVLFSSSNGLVRADSAYSNKIFGVLQQNALIVYRDVGNKGQPVARTGIAQVNVTNINGSVSKGDYITSSEIAGKGQKATQSGYILGIALDNFSGEGAQSLEYSGKAYKAGKIAVALKIEYAEINTSRSLTRLFDYFNAAIFKNVQDPDRFVLIIRYLAAGITVIIAFAISFLTFSRAVAKGVEGIGRNPLARNAIQFSIIINAALTTVIVLVGVIASFIILKL